MAGNASTKKNHRSTRSKLLPADYIPYLIPMIGTPPYRFSGMTNFTLFLEADPSFTSGEHDLVARYLNGPLGCSDNDCIYRLANINPFLVLSDVKNSVSTQGGSKHSIAYQEISLIVPVVIDEQQSGYFMPILFVDGPAGGGDQLQGSIPIVIGREMYGLPKIPASIEFDYQGRRLNAASVSLFGEEIVTVTPKQTHGPEHDGHYTGPQRHQFAEKVFGTIKPNQDYTSGQLSSGAVVDLRHIGHGNPLIGLRQMRNSRELKLSGHQDIVESPYILESQTMPSPLGNALTVEFDLTSGYFSELHLQPKYELDQPTDGVVYSDVTATFGDPDETVIRHAAGS
jgi:hypothetical protein